MAGRFPFMAVARANWKGYLRLGELSCPVALFTAASAAERVAFHVVERSSGRRLHRRLVDRATGEPVGQEEQVKGYEISKNEYIVLEPGEVASAVPASDKTLEIGSFVKCDEVDDVFFHRPYYLAPDGKVAGESFTLLRDGMRSNEVVAIGQAVLFRRLCTLLIRPYGRGLVASTLAFDYEIRSTKEAFDNIPEMETGDEMLDLARHIIDTKKGVFDPHVFKDRYEEAIIELVRAKLAGKPIKVKKPEPERRVVNLLDALRRSASIEPRTGAKRPAHHATAHRTRRKAS